ncbi:putative Holliday junction resolvase [Mycoplasma testudineum]|uniref:Putative pre-16S rRNA nuclease n=1 Tax=Mycoplasma testudineum TaxID=244584 RepID=A0A4R6ICT4_9MOLU|nr:Holliday junction resolvase RuvX [Mycoplasma testudineum]OYD26566.1 Holliday junction resolvase RuvX [Mycoplasma testudineum]TDO19397.1 putative Holliday junction resolvase [Mycoplasma testudineum]
MRIVGLDLGSRSCGIAISDPFKMFANPLENYFFKEYDFNSLIKHIATLFDEFKIESFVLGYPLRQTGTKSQTTEMIEDFKLLLESQFNLPVYLVDERLSTKKAKEILKQGKISSTKAKNHKDVLAAVIILNEYLNNF